MSPASYSAPVSTGGSVSLPPEFTEKFIDLSAYTEFSPGAAPSVENGKIKVATLGAWSRFYRNGTSLINSRQMFGHLPQVAGISQLMLISYYLDANNYLFADWRVSALGGALYIYKIDGGVGTLLVSTSTAAGEYAPVAGAPTFLVLSDAGNSITAGGYAGHPNIAKPIRELTVVLSGADAAKFGADVAGGVGFGVVGASLLDRWNDHICISDLPEAAF